MKTKLRNARTVIKRELHVLRLVGIHPDTPWFSKTCLILALGYLALPFDLIPDFIPIIGQLDDLIIVPGLVWLALRLTPADVLANCRQQS